MSYRLMLPLLLIALLGADGVLGAWASTRMALHAMSASGPLAAARDGTAGEACDLPAQDTAPARAAHGDHDRSRQGGDADCVDRASCDCVCVLTFYPPSLTTLFATRHLPISMDTLFPSLEVPPRKLSRVFRPPIA